jgi:uncharacterized protein (TIGR00725 family)
MGRREMRAIIPAAGRGTRLRPQTEDVPKCLLEVAGRPILEHAFLRLAPFRPRELVVVVGWRGDRIRDRFGPRWKGIPVRYVRQDEPLGLAHALALASADTSGPFLVMHGDVVFGPESDLAPLVEEFQARRASAAVLTERLDPGSIARGAVQVDADGRVLALSEYPGRAERAWGRVAAGFYAFAPEAAAAFRAIQPSDAGEYELPDALSWLLAQGRTVHALDLDGRRVNVNTPDDLARARDLFPSGQPAVEPGSPPGYRPDRRHPSVRPRVTVVGSGIRPHRERAGPLGAALADLGVHLVTGGGGGVMAAVARGFTGVHPRRGLSLGILPARAGGALTPEPPPGYPNPYVELPVMTHLAARGEKGLEPGSRNHLVALTGDVVVALPGGSGTRTEVELALRYGKPVVAHLHRRSELPGLPTPVPLASTLDEVLTFLRDRIMPGEE